MQEKPIYFAVHAKMMLAGVPFSALLMHKENATVLEADWQNDAHPVGLCDLAECCKLNLSYLQSWDIEVTKAQFSLVTGQKDPTVDFQLVSERYGSLEIQAMQTQFSMQLFPPAEKQSIDCTKLPFLGNYLSEGDCLELYRVAVEYTAQQVTALADFSLVLFGKKIFEQKEQGRLGEQLAKWVDVNKSVGPVTVHRIGFAMEGQYLGLLLDSSFALGPITVSTLGLCLQVPVDLDFKKTKCSIEGIAVEYSSGGIFLAGGLVCTDGQTERYDGVLQLRAFGLCMSALASYAVTEDETSLFVYAYLRLPTGIGSGFTITGFSAGLGTNRRLLLPDISKVSEFPLIAMATADQPLTSTDQMLRQMQQCLLVEQDSYFVAAGISFQTFGLLDGFALASVSFGKRLEIALLGQCTLQVPEKTKSPLAKVVLPFSVQFLPDEGVFSAQAIIGCGSFLLDPNCHLTGGFACFLWFDGQYKGDFVVTVGGYHPRFRPPPHYPTVDRVGVDWKMDSHLQLTGGLYFSLTPAAIMAGGGLSLTYQLGNLKAWVNAQADFLVQWSPVYYDIQIGVSVGASYRVDFLFIHHTFSVELGASLLLQGPPFYGKVHVKWCIISFTISFGKQTGAPPALSWQQFCQTFLPEHPLTFSPAVGIEQLEGEKGWCLTRTDFSLQLGCQLPFTAFQYNHGELKQLVSPVLGIRPMQKKEVAIQLHLICEKDIGNGFKPMDVSCSLTKSRMPEALWGQPGDDPLSPGLIEGCYTGAVLFRKDEPTHSTSSYSVQMLMDASESAQASLAPPSVQHIAPVSYEQQQAVDLLHRSADEDVCEKRQKVLQQLANEQFLFQPCEIKGFAQDFERLLRCIPQLGTIGAQEEERCSRI